MRHGKATAKLGMKSQHRRATLANLVCSLIKNRSIRTTVAKAKEARRHADKMITLAKKADAVTDRAQKVHYRRQALAFLRQPDAVSKLFTELGKAHTDRKGGYTRIIRVGNRVGDAAEMVVLEWTGVVAPSPSPEKEKGGKEAKPKGEKQAKKKEVKE